MAVIYDRSARTFIVTMDSERSQMREHRAEPPRATVCSESARRSLRKAGQEVVSVLLRASPTRLSFGHLKVALPHVSESTLFSRLRDMSARGVLLRSVYSNYEKQGAIVGGFKEFLYGLTTTAGST